MNTTNTFTAVLGITTMLGVSVQPASARQDAVRFEQPPLLVDLGDWDVNGQDDTVLRSRPVWIDAAQLNEFETDGGAALSFDLFEDVRVAAIVERVERT